MDNMSLSGRRGGAWGGLLYYWEPGLACLRLFQVSEIGPLSSHYESYCRAL